MAQDDRYWASQWHMASDPWTWVPMIAFAPLGVAGLAARSGLPVKPLASNIFGKLGASYAAEEYTFSIAADTLFHQTFDEYVDHPVLAMVGSVIAGSVVGTAIGEKLAKAIGKDLGQPWTSDIVKRHAKAQMSKLVNQGKVTETGAGVMQEILASVDQGTKRLGQFDSKSVQKVLADELTIRGVTQDPAQIAKLTSDIKATGLRLEDAQVALTRAQYDADAASSRVATAEANGVVGDALEAMKGEAYKAGRALTEASNAHNSVQGIHTIKANALASVQQVAKKSSGQKVVRTTSAGAGSDVPMGDAIDFKAMPKDQLRSVLEPHIPDMAKEPQLNALVRQVIEGMRSEGKIITLETFDKMVKILRKEQK